MLLAQLLNSVILTTTLLGANRCAFTHDIKDFIKAFWRQQLIHLTFKCSASEGLNQDLKARASSYNTDPKQVKYKWLQNTGQVKKGKKKLKKSLHPSKLDPFYDPVTETD